MADKDDEISGWQKFYDNLPLLFILGLIIMVVFYTGWGLIEIILQPSSPK